MANKTIRAMTEGTLAIGSVLVLCASALSTIGCGPKPWNPLKPEALELTDRQVGLIVWNQYKKHYAGYYEYKITFDAPETGCKWSVPQGADYASHTGPAPQIFPWPKECKRDYVQVEVRIRPSPGRAEDFTNYQQLAIRGQPLASYIFEHTD